MRRIIQYIFLIILPITGIAQDDILGRYYLQGYENTSVSIEFKEKNIYEIKFSDCTEFERSFGIWSIENDTLILHSISSIEIEHKYLDLIPSNIEKPSILRIKKHWTKIGDNRHENIEIFGQTDNNTQKLNLESLKSQMDSIEYEKYVIYSNDILIGEIDTNELEERGVNIVVNLYLNNPDLEKRWIRNRKIPMSKIISYSNAKLLTGVELWGKLIEIKEK